MALNAVTIAAIVAACWAHPQGVSYLDKIAQIDALSLSCGNPCCNQLGSGQRRAREEELWKNLPDFFPPKKEVKTEEIVVVEKVFLPSSEVSPTEVASIAREVARKLRKTTTIVVEDDEEAILLLLGVF